MTEDQTAWTGRRGILVTRDCPAMVREFKFGCEQGGEMQLLIQATPRGKVPTEASLSSYLDSFDEGIEGERLADEICTDLYWTLDPYRIEVVASWCKNGIAFEAAARKGGEWL